MCDPVSALAIGSFVVGSAQAVVSYQASQADYKAKNAAYFQNIQNTETAERDDQTSILQHQLQEQDKGTQKEQISQIEEAQKSSTEEVSAAEGGVSGVSVDNLLNDIAGKSELNRSYMDENMRWIVADTHNRLTNTGDQAAARIASVAQPIEPSILSPILGIAGAGLKAGTGYRSMTAGGTSNASTGD